MARSTEVGLSPDYIVLDGTQLPPKKVTGSPHFSAHVSCGQTVGLIKIPLGTEVGLVPGDIVLDGNPNFPLKRGHSIPHCLAIVYCTKRLVDKDANWSETGPRSRRHCVQLIPLFS